MSFERHGVLSQWQFDCLFNHLVRLTSKTTSKFSITSPLWVEYIQQFLHMTSNKRHVKSPATRLFIQQFIQAYHKGKIKALHFWFLVRRIRWQMDFPREKPAIQEAFSFILTIHQQRQHQSYWYIFDTLKYWEFLVQVLRIRMARLHMERNKSRRKFLN